MTTHKRPEWVERVRNDPTPEQQVKFSREFLNRTKEPIGKA